ncbi:hypothetical protein KQI42_20605 [Tissierella sp. MSJ-40]|uniref:Uncharacterized protein n=1 Tax=Tissierella simiarum TaxID=2841534 RepID=A0ABS6EBV2_9FIRM|nr:hypothetical protein [Tissierella simiarum]MBU5440398.1 hypothetical protein [Tissierella simiarum]
MDIKITKDADVLICLLYKQYCQQRKDGVPKLQSKLFGSSIEVQKSIAPKWTPEEVDETCRELDRAGLIECLYAENIVYEFYLSDTGIIYMENRFQDGLNSVLDYLGKIRNLLPF